MRRLSFPLGFVLLWMLCPPSSMAQNADENIDREYTRSGASDSWWWKWVRQSVGIQKSYAVVVGISNYSRGFKRLEAPSRDAIRVKDFLLNQAGFDSVYLLTNSAVTRERLDKLMEEVIPERLKGRHDRFLFYFSGHGTQRQVGENKVVGYLPLAGAGESEYANMIGMDVISSWDSLLEPTPHVLFVLDACFSGLAGVQHKGSSRDMRLERLSQYAHHLVTAGSAKEESFASLKQWGGSLFTSAFIAGAAGRADSENTDFGKDGIVSLNELMDYVGKEIDKARAANKAIRMSPQLSILQPATVGEFFFVNQDAKIPVPDAMSAKEKYGIGGPLESYGPQPQYNKVPQDLQVKFLACETWSRWQTARTRRSSW